MSDGMLTIDYNEPAYVCFAPIGQIGNRPRYCSPDELRDLLLELGLTADIQFTPCQDIVLRIPIQISDTQLIHMKLAA